MAVLGLLLDHARNVDEHIRSFFRRKPTDEPDKGNLERNIQCRTETTRSHGGRKNTGINAICDISQLAGGNTQAQRMKLSRFRYDAEMSLGNFVDFKVPQAQIAAVDGS